MTVPSFFASLALFSFVLLVALKLLFFVSSFWERFLRSVLRLSFSGSWEIL